MRALIIHKSPTWHKAGPQLNWNESGIKRKYGLNVTLNQLSDPQGNVQKCVSTPEEKRRTAQEKKLITQIEKGKTENRIKEIQELQEKNSKEEIGREEIQELSKEMFPGIV